jgi:hypothetical protein
MHQEVEQGQRRYYSARKVSVTMPLQIYSDEGTFASAAPSVVVETSQVDVRRRYWILMGGFGVANSLQEDTALATSGAASCQIIIVHKGPGHGALGHYAALEDPQWIVRGVSQMTKALGGPPIADVVFAAGEIGAGDTQEQYRNTILRWVRTLCPGALVHWPTAAADKHFGVAYYLPLAEEIALFKDQPIGGGWDGSGDLYPGFGITIHNYAST